MAVLATVILATGSRAAAPLPSPRSQGDPTIARARYLMGTIVRVEAVSGTDPHETGATLDSALDRIDELERALSNWREDSELSVLNRRAVGRPVETTRDLFDAIEASLEWAARTGGAFDPTVEATTRRFRGEIAAGEVRCDARPEAWLGVRLDRSRLTVDLGRQGCGIDLGGIGKGYALDRAAELLRLRGVSDGLLDAGGQILALGHPPADEAWTIELAHPLERERGVVVLRLRDLSVATSGNATRPGEVVDPSTGASIRGGWSATAIALDATSADAMSTALFVMGPERGLEWARDRDDVVALFVEPVSGAGPLVRVRSSHVDPFPFECVLEATVVVEDARRKIRVRCA